MDLFKQCSEEVVTLENEFPALSASLERFGITTVDLLSASKVPDGISRLARKIKRSVNEVTQFIERLYGSMSHGIEDINILESIKRPLHMSTGLESLDRKLDGGVPCGAISEVFGASGTGKSQLLLQMSIENLESCAVSKTVYISTESNIATTRLHDLAGNEKSSQLMERILSVYCSDIEQQDHIIFTQLPVLLERDVNINLVIIDSISHHLRHDDQISNSTYLESHVKGQEARLMKSPSGRGLKEIHTDQLTRFFRYSSRYKTSQLRSTYIYLLQNHLRILAKKHGVAIVIANQVSDQPTYSYESNIPDSCALDLDYQIGSFLGWDNAVLFSYQEPESHDVLLTMAPYDDNSRRKRQKPNHKNGADTENNSAIQSTLDTSASALNPKADTLISTRKQTPALGYQWIKNIQCRILLMKSYDFSPLPYQGKAEIERVARDSQSFPVDADYKHDHIHKTENSPEPNPSWICRRFFKVINNDKCSSTNAESGEKETPKIEFSLDTHGLHPA